MLNASQLENNISKDEIKPKNIIENLIRRLFSTVNYENSCLDASLRHKIESLYRKAIASNFEKLESSTSQREYLQEDGIEERIEIAFNEKNLIFIGSWSIALILQLMPVFPWEAINKIVPMLLAFPIPYSINILHRNHSILKNIKLDKNNIEEIYKFDNSLGNLEFDLEKLHREISRNGRKIIYIIDELDKLDPKYTEKILNYFKNFFTHSDAIFIFIGGEEIYEPIPLNKNINQNGEFL